MNKFYNLEELFYYFKYCSVCEHNECKIDIVNTFDNTIYKFETKNNLLIFWKNFGSRKFKINLKTNKLISSNKIDRWLYLKIQALCSTCHSYKISNPILINIYRELVELDLTAQYLNYNNLKLSIDSEDDIIINDIVFEKFTENYFDWFNYQFDKEKFLSKIEIIQTFI